jgi:hypothetical protein
MAVFPEQCLHRHHSGVLTEAWGIAELPKERCHLFHLFYQVQIRLGSPRSSAVLAVFCSKITALLHLARSPGPPHR